MISEIENAQILFSLHTIINEATYLTDKHKKALGLKMYKQLKDSVENAAAYDFLAPLEEGVIDTKSNKKHLGYKK